MYLEVPYLNEALSGKCTQTEPTAAYQVLHMLCYPRGVGTLAGEGGRYLGVPPVLAGGGGILAREVGTLGSPHPDLA